MRDRRFAVRFSMVWLWTALLAGGHSCDALAAAAADAGAASMPGTKFRDCINCPEMIVVPSGHAAVRWRPELVGPRIDFPADPETPLLTRDVKFEQTFAAGIYDVTRDEYAAFARETGRTSQQGCYIWNGDQWTEDPTKNWLDPGFPQTGRDPVVCVNWNDAQAFVRWLNGKTAGREHMTGVPGEGPYRLPVWNEAAYLAAGGAVSAYFWGDRPSRDYANYGADRCRPCNPAKEGGDRWLHTSPAGSFPSNGFGLYDIAGNVWQWTDSCSPADQRHAPSCQYGLKFSGSGLVVGGSWLDGPQALKLSEYHGSDFVNRNNATGFRVVKNLGTAAVTATGIDRVDTAFRDCPSCPKMVVVPPGSATLEIDPIGGGAPHDATAETTRVTISKAFAIGMYDVTRAEYEMFVRDTKRAGGEGCQFNDGQLWITDGEKNWRRPGFAQTGDHPVVCVSWEDAQAYVQWLNNKVGTSQRSKGGPYRLPSGAEWRYVASSGAQAPAAYYWGHEPSHNRANYGLDHCWPCGVAKEGKDRWDYTSPVGSFAPNDFGVYDIVGNVWQWTDDCFHEPRTVTADGSVWKDGDCSRRFIRGGSYDDAASTLRVDRPIAAPYPIHVRNNANGFRVVKDLE